MKTWYDFDVTINRHQLAELIEADVNEKLFEYKNINYHADTKELEEIARILGSDIELTRHKLRVLIGVKKGELPFIEIDVRTMYEPEESVSGRVIENGTSSSVLIIVSCSLATMFPAGDSTSMLRDAGALSLAFPSLIVKSNIAPASACDERLLEEIVISLPGSMRINAAPITSTANTIPRTKSALLGKEI